MDARVFYTFMGINVIRKAGAAKCKFVPSGPMGAIPVCRPLRVGFRPERVLFPPWGGGTASQDCHCLRRWQN